MTCAQTKCKQTKYRLDCRRLGRRYSSALLLWTIASLLVACGGGGGGTARNSGAAATVYWLDNLGYQKPAALDIAMPDASD